ncbi:MAG: hypothetical protein ACR2KU_13940 [Gammaproteobacteria bacterium]
MSAVIALPGLSGLNGVSGAQGNTVTFSGINDAVPGKYYDPTTTAPGPVDGNTLVIGLKSFIASSEYPYRRVAMDTISFRVAAPAGFYVSRLTYSHTVNLSTSRGGGARWAGNWIVGNAAADLGSGGVTRRIARAIDLTGQNKTVLPVSISNALFAHGLSVTSGTASISRASVRIELLPL